MNEIMRPTPCQMQIINRYLPTATVSDCRVIYEGGTHYTDGRDYDGWFCVKVNRFRYKYADRQFKREYR